MKERAWGSSSLLFRSDLFRAPSSLPLSFQRWVLFSSTPSFYSRHYLCQRRSSSPFSANVPASRNLASFGYNTWASGIKGISWLGPMQIGGRQLIVEWRAGYSRNILTRGQTLFIFLRAEPHRHVILISSTFPFPSLSRERGQGSEEGTSDSDVSRPRSAWIYFRRASHSYSSCFRVCLLLTRAFKAHHTI